MPSKKAAVVLGASGSVGSALISELLRWRSFNAMVTLVRHSQHDQLALARDLGSSSAKNSSRQWNPFV